MAGPLPASHLWLPTTIDTAVKFQQDHLKLWDEAVIGTICCQEVQLLLPIIALVGGIHIAGGDSQQGRPTGVPQQADTVCLQGRWPVLLPFKFFWPLKGFTSRLIPVELHGGLTLFARKASDFLQLYVGRQLMHSGQEAGNYTWPCLALPDHPQRQHEQDSLYRKFQSGKACKHCSLTG